MKINFMAGAVTLLATLYLSGCTSPYGPEPPPALPELSSITLEGQGKAWNLVPAFSSKLTSYALTVPNGVPKLTLAAVPAQSNFTVTGTGEWSLEEGLNTRSVVVSSPSGTVRTYSLSVTRSPASTDASLSSLEVKSGSTVLLLDTPFSSGDLDYYLDVESTVTEVTVAAQANHEFSQVEGTGVKALVSGLNTISVTVTSESGEALTYKILINRMASGVQTVAEPTFNPLPGMLPGPDTPVGMSSTTPGATIRYTLGDGSQPSPSSTSGTVYEATSKPRITQSAKVIKALAYKEGMTASGVVTAIYSLPSSEASLSSLTVSASSGTPALSPAFSPGIYAYGITVPNGVTSVTLAATPTDSSAAVTGTGEYSGLTVGVNPVRTITVTAADGTTVKTYSLTVTRAAQGASTDATLTSLGLSSGTLSPAFTPGTTAYSAAVDWNVEEITLTAAAAHGGATLSGTGVKKLSVGTNTLTLTVTAEAGNTVAYVITLTRASPPTADVSVTVTLQNPGEPALVWTLGGTFTGTWEDNNLTLTQGTSPMTVSVSASSGTLGSLAWRINGTTIHTGNGLSLDPASLNVGPQQLVLRFFLDGQEYSQSVRITIRN